MNTLPSENLPGQTCESAPPLQQREHGHFHQSDFACNALPLRQTGLNEIYPTRSKEGIPTSSASAPLSSRPVEDGGQKHVLEWAALNLRW